MVLFIGLIGTWEDKILFSIFFYLNICVSVIIAQWQYYSCANILEKLVGYGKVSTTTITLLVFLLCCDMLSSYKNRKQIVFVNFCLSIGSIYYFISLFENNLKYKVRYYLSFLVIRKITFPFFVVVLNYIRFFTFRIITICDFSSNQYCIQINYL